MAKPKKAVAKTTENYLNKIETEIQSNQSKLNMVLGALIVLVVGILIFNYFNKPKTDLGPAQNIESQQDVSPDNLPGKYTVKEGDTLFTIAEKYYNDGYKYTEIVKANNITDPNNVLVGQVLEIPKLEEAVSVEVSPTPSLEPETTEVPTTEQPAVVEPGSKGAPDTTMIEQSFGPKITGDKYTVVEGDWLSTIAARAYGDIYAYKKIADANDIANPDLIEPGQVLTIPR